MEEKTKTQVITLEGLKKFVDIAKPFSTITHLYYTAKFEESQNKLIGQYIQYRHYDITGHFKKLNVNISIEDAFNTLTTLGIDIPKNVFNINFGTNVNAATIFEKIHQVDWTLATKEWFLIQDMFNESLLKYAFILGKQNDLPSLIRKNIGIEQLNNSLQTYEPKAFQEPGMWKGWDSNITLPWDKKLHQSIIQSSTKIEKHVNQVFYITKNNKEEKNKNFFEKLDLALSKKVYVKSYLLWAEYAKQRYKKTTKSILSQLPKFNNMMLDSKIPEHSRKSQNNPNDCIIKLAEKSIIVGKGIRFNIQTQKLDFQKSINTIKKKGVHINTKVLLEQVSNIHNDPIQLFELINLVDEKQKDTTNIELKLRYKPNKIKIDRNIDLLEMHQKLYTLLGTEFIEELNQIKKRIRNFKKVHI